MTAIDLNAKAIIAVAVPEILHAWFPNIRRDADPLHVLRMTYTASDEPDLGCSTLLTKEEYSMEILLLHATRSS